MKHSIITTVIIILRRALVCAVLALPFMVSGQPVNISTTTINTCDAIVYDEGGPNGDYPDDANDKTLTICSTSGGVLYLIVDFFEIGVDFTGASTERLIIYDGTGTGGPVLWDSNSGTVPSAILSTSGSCVTIFWDKETSFFPESGLDGFQVTVSCTLPETCTDGVLNNGEVQIDCGGPNCLPCYVFTACGSNVVYNGDFETPNNPVCNAVNGGPYGSTNQIPRPWYDQTPADGWWGTQRRIDNNISYPTPDYRSNCTNASPHFCMDGQGSMGMFVHFGNNQSAEYVQTRLLTPLVAGEQYCVSLKVVAGRNDPSSPTDKLGLWFHNRTFASGNGFIDIDADNGSDPFIGAGSIVNGIPQIVNPQGNMITSDVCIDMNFTFCANGGEEYLVIGNFTPGLPASGSTEYITVDNISVIPSCPLTFNTQLTASNPNPDCSGECVDLTITANNFSGGCVVTNDVTYLWSNGSTATTINVCPTGPSTYTVSITYSAGCKTTTLTESIIFCAVPCNLTVSADSTDETCGASDGTATAIPSGGTSPYTYSWNTVPIQTTFTATGLSAGTYTVIVTDSSGCADTASVTVNNIGGNITIIFTSTNVSCNGLCDGTATANPSGGTAPYTYQWDANAGNQTTQTATGLCAGSYSVTVTDADVCTETDSVEITQPDELILTTNSSDIGCFNGNDGTASVSATGGTVPYSFSWTPTGGNDSIASGLNAGTYTVFVTDNNGCTALDTITITEPPVIVLSLTETPAACGSSDGSATVVASGGTGSYTYSWSPTGGTTPSATGLAAGIYTVAVTDANGCSQLDSIAITNIGGATLSITSSADVSCFGYSNGQATVSASGGTPAYTYSWNTNPVQTDSTATGLSAGSYTCTVIDANSCISIVNVIISEPDSIIITLTADTIICIGDSVTISVSATGGTAPYTYTWDNGLGNGSAHTVSPDSIATYTVIVFDANLCPAVTQSVTVATNTPLSVTAFGTATICSGDSTLITANANGGDGGPYTYSWSNGAGTGNPVFVSPANTTTYIVTVSDACNSPVAIDSITITVNPELVLTPTSENICPGENAVLNVSGALSYLWIDETTMDTLGTGSTITVNPSVTTNYLIIGFDSVCWKTDTVSVIVNPSPGADFGFNPQETTITNPTFNFEDLSSPGVVSWSWYFGDGDTSTVENSTHTYADTGTYLVMLIVTDSLGCSDTILKPVTVKDEYILFVPNTFTPNNDNQNDVFIPKGIGIDVNNFEMYIYNRWGDEIFKTTDFSQGWDGRANNGSKIAQQDIYVWVVYTNNLGKKHQYIGHVTLIR